MEELLIEKVREREVIYNIKLSDYRDQHVRQTAWEEIAKELNISASEGKDRWDKLRRCFCNARNRRRADQKRGTAYKKKSLWKYEQQMEFLTPFLESRKAHSNLNVSQSSYPTTDAEDIILAEGSDSEETSLCTTQGEKVNLDTGNERGARSYETAGEEEDSISNGNVEKSYQDLKRMQNRKRLNDTPVCQMVRILKENSDLRKRKYEERKLCATPSTKTGPFDTLDEMDMFFLSMSRMTKQLPKLCQTQIKLGLSNAVLSAEIRNQQQLCPPQNSLHAVQQQSSCSSTPSPNPSNIQPMTSPSDCSKEENLSSKTEQSPTILDVIKT